MLEAESFFPNDLDHAKFPVIKKILNQSSNLKSSNHVGYLENVVDYQTIVHLHQKKSGNKPGGLR